MVCWLYAFMLNQPTPGEDLMKAKNVQLLECMSAQTWRQEKQMWEQDIDLTDDTQQVPG